MGLGGFFKKLGKGALKVGKWAAVPALAATGVGIPAAVAIGAGLSAADTKASGGSWKDALLSGGISAGTGALAGGAMGSLTKGILGKGASAGLSLPGGIPASAGGAAITGAAKKGLGATIGGAIAGGAKAAGKQVMGNLASPGGLEAASKALGAGSQAAASNRGTKAELLMDQNAQLEEQLLAREEEKRRAQGQAYRAAMMGNYAQNWKPLSRPSGIFGAYQQMPESAMAIGKTLEGQGKARLAAPDLTAQAGMPAYRNLLQDKAFKKTLDPGLWEKLSGYGSAALPLLGGSKPEVQ